MLCLTRVVFDRATIVKYTKNKQNTFSFNLLCKYKNLLTLKFSQKVLNTIRPMVGNRTNFCLTNHNEQLQEENFPHILIPGFLSIPPNTT